MLGKFSPKKFALLAIFFCAFFSAAAEEPRIADERILLHTDGGDIVLALFPDVAPKHVEQLLKLVRLGVYDTIHFHRLEPGFVLQLTDCSDYNRLTKMTAEQKAAIKKLPTEFSGIKHVRGILSMARQNDDINSAETSFSILLGDAPHLDGHYTVFGKVERGMEVVDYLEQIRRKKNTTTPIVRLTIRSAEVVTAKQLAAMTLIPKQTIRAPLSAEDDDADSQGESVASFSRPREAVLAGLAFVVIVGLLGFLVSKRASPRALLIFNLLHLLVAGVLLLVMLTAAGRSFANLTPKPDDDEFTVRVAGHEPEVIENLSVVFDNFNKPALAGMAGVIVVALLGVVLTRAAPKTVMSLNLINVLIAFFLLFAIVAPITQSNKVLACCLFLGAISIFKLMSSFESA